MPHAFLCHPANVSLPEPVRLVPFIFTLCSLSSQRAISAKKKAAQVGLTPVFETGIKTPFIQPIADSLSVIGCL
ncbi:hypothetical protein P9E52_07210, partial [Bacillus halotolerans]|nr:hypothetical protein [Bacillus halotolerans]